MLIGELAKQVGCPVATIRYYEKEGLLPAPQRSATGYRHYRAEQVGGLNFILHCRSLGMTLAEIRQLQAIRADPDQPCEAVNALLDQQIARVQEQMEALRLLEAQLKGLRGRCQALQTAAECGILRTLAYEPGAGCHCQADSLTPSPSGADGLEG